MDPCFEISPRKYVGKNQPCFIIAEVGQNHQGSIDTAKKLVRIAMECGADCVKFQKSDLSSRFTSHVLQKPYLSSHSWGNTYGDHRKHLELTDDDFKELKRYCIEIGIIFSATGMDIPSLEFLKSLDIPFFKIGSGDITNMPLIRFVANLGKPLIISTGMSEMEDIIKVYDEVTKYNKSLAILQCTSCYPSVPSDAHLNVLQTYKSQFPDAVIGYSSHEKGITATLAAVACGAKIIERHITMDHNLKGSDHVASLEKSELQELIANVRKIEDSLGSYTKRFLTCELPCYEKLGKTIVSNGCLSKGTLLNETMLSVKVAQRKGCKPIHFYDLIGKKLKRNLGYEETINYDDIE